jgi:hypothetical protein
LQSVSFSPGWQMQAVMNNTYSAKIQPPDNDQAVICKLASTTY